MSGSSQAVVFSRGSEFLVGVLDVPRTPADTAILVVVGGPQYRAGSHRQFVSLALRLRSAGYAVLRFDCRGMGDSEGSMRSFEDVSEDIGAAIDALHQRVPHIRRVVLWGLCDGASAALLYHHDTRDARVGGICLLNPWVRSDVSLARTQVKHYYADRLTQRSFWSKLMRGGVGGTALRGLWDNLASATTQPQKLSAAFQDRMAIAWHRFEGPSLLLLSENDYTAKEFIEYTCGNATWLALLNRASVTRMSIAGADHTFSAAVARRACEDITIEWLQGLAPA